MKILRKIWARQSLFSTIFVCFLTVLVVSFSLSTFLVPHAETAETTEDSWETKAEMPTARGGFGVAVVNGKIYAIGGYNLDSGYLSTNEEYDPATDTWTTKESMPTPRTDLAIAVYQNKIYVIGGHRLVPSGYEVFGTNEVYDPLTDTWETKTSMPTNRSMLRANVVNGKIYLIGGGYPTYLGIGRRDTNEVYDPLTDSWTTKTPMPTAEFYYASAVVDSKIYVMSYNNLTQIYDPETDTWIFGKPMPTSVSNAAAGATTGVMAPKRIYVIGGGTRFSLSTGLVQVYDPEGDAWDTGTSMPTPRSGLCIAVANDVLYAIGGSRPPITAVNEQFTPFGYTGVHGTIYIKSDGSVDPDTAPIQIDGNVYSFTDDIFGSIVVENDNIVVDGLGYTVQGDGSGTGMNLTGRSNVTIVNAKIKDFRYGIFHDYFQIPVPPSENMTNNNDAVHLSNSGNTISGNTITDNVYGIHLSCASGNTISGNIITNNYNDILLKPSGNNNISGNTIANNWYGIHVSGTSDYNSIFGNNITANGYCGIFLDDFSSLNTIVGNIITNNYNGIYLGESTNNHIYHNDFMSNTQQVYTSNLTNVWDNGYPSGGNYWSDYEERYPNATEIDGSGMWDTPYIIDENNKDRYPLMDPVVIPEFADDDNPTKRTTEPFPTTWIATTTVLIAAIGVGLLLYFVKVKKTTVKTE
jgi:parallel beta-helix repeat protein